MLSRASAESGEPGAGWLSLLRSIWPREPVPGARRPSRWPCQEAPLRGLPDVRLPTHQSRTQMLGATSDRTKTAPRSNGGPALKPKRGTPCRALNTVQLSTTDV
jgi:hypothetical protein